MKNAILRLLVYLLGEQMINNLFMQIHLKDYLLNWQIIKKTKKGHIRDNIVVAYYFNSNEKVIEMRAGRHFEKMDEMLLNNTWRIVDLQNTKETRQQRKERIAKQSKTSFIIEREKRRQKKVENLTKRAEKSAAKKIREQKKEYNRMKKLRKVFSKKAA